MLVVQLVWWDGALWLARAVIAFAMSFAGSLWPRCNPGCRTEHMSAVAWYRHTRPPWRGVASSVARPTWRRSGQPVVDDGRDGSEGLCLRCMTDGLASVAVA